MTLNGLVWQIPAKTATPRPPAWQISHFFLEDFLKNKTDLITKVYGPDENLNSLHLGYHMEKTNVTVISNNDCKIILASNSSLDDSGSMKENLDKALANGINYGLLCGQGKKIKNCQDIVVP